MTQAVKLSHNIPRAFSSNLSKLQDGRLRNRRSMGGL